MTAPRPVEPEATVMITRRSTGRTCLFRPDEDRTTQGNFLYALAVRAEKHKIRLHAFNQCSDHHHVNCTDTEGKHPKFTQDFHRDLATATKKHRRWREEVFSSAAPSVVTLASPAAMIQEIAYTIAQGALNGAVRYSKDWPGAFSRLEDLGRLVMRVQRPKNWFSKNDRKWPPFVTLRLTLPDQLVEFCGGEDQVRAAVRHEVERLERESRAEMEREGRSFMGERRVLRLDYTHRLQSEEPERTLNPTFAAAGDPEVTKAALEKLREFRRAYARALDAWKRGLRDVIFPFGTWWLRVHHGVSCAPAPG